MPFEMWRREQSELAGAQTGVCCADDAEARHNDASIGPHRSKWQAQKANESVIAYLFISFFGTRQM